MNDNGYRFNRRQDCPDAATLHSEPPMDMNVNGYSPTSRQVRCPTCGFWSMWVPRKPRHDGGKP